jgi:uncharacterized membrane-anchored protein
MIGLVLDDLYQLQQVVLELLVGQGLKTLDRVLTDLKSGVSNGQLFALLKRARCYLGIRKLGV